MNLAEHLWNNLEFCLKRRSEQADYLQGLYKKLFKQEITEERFKELWASGYGQLVRFRERVKKLENDKMEIQAKWILSCTS